jgi:hypothetical protein
MENRQAEAARHETGVARLVDTEHGGLCQAVDPDEEKLSFTKLQRRGTAR